VGTRGSQLALVQTQMVIDAIHRFAPAAQVDIAIIKTEGDRNRHDSLTMLGGRGVFVRDIEERLLTGEIDFAVHSLKDLPTTQPDGLHLIAVSAREDARDVMVSHNHRRLADLPCGARVGSSSQRRAAQLLALRPDLQLLDIRGNVDTRLRKLDDGEHDAIVLAAAGLIRLNLAARITQYFSMEEMLPAVAQGAMVVECRADDSRTRELLAPCDHAPTRAAISAERAFLRGLGGGCQLPIAAFAEIRDGQLHLRGLVARPDGQYSVRDEIVGAVAQAESLGEQLATCLMQNGALELMEAARVESRQAT
ncbi:MAG: hydroxymethylbilane synthase, partial [Chloroflexota bacterium]